jgi:hypothetical protein
MMKEIKRKNLTSYIAEINKIVLADVMFSGDCDNKNRQEEKLVKVGRGSLAQPLIFGFKVPKTLFDTTIKEVQNNLSALDMNSLAKEIGGNTPDDIKDWLRYNLDDTEYAKYLKTFTFGECCVNTSSLNILRAALKTGGADAVFSSQVERLYKYYRLQEIYADTQYLSKVVKGNTVKPRISVINGHYLNWDNVKGYVRDGFAYFATKDQTMNYYVLSPYLFQEQMLLAILATFLRIEKRAKNDVLERRDFTGKTYKILQNQGESGIIQNAITYSRQMNCGYLFKGLTKEQENDLIQDILTLMPRICDGIGKDDYLSTVFRTSNLRNLNNGESTAIGSVYSTVYAIYVEAIMGIWVKELSNSIEWAKQNIANLNCAITYANAKMAIIGVDKNVDVRKIFGTTNASFLRPIKDVTFETMIENNISSAYA